MCFPSAPTKGITLLHCHVVGGFPEQREEVLGILWCLFLGERRKIKINPKQLSLPFHVVSPSIFPSAITL